MVYTFLLIISLIFAIFAYFLFSKEFLAPPFIMIVSMLFTVVLMASQWRAWSVDKLHWQTVSVVTLGMAATLFGGGAGRYSGRKLINGSVPASDKMNASYSGKMIFVILGFIAIVLYYVDLARVLGTYDITKMSYAFKHLSLSLSENVDVSELAVVSAPIKVIYYVMRGGFLSYIYMLCNQVLEAKRILLVDVVALTIGIGLILLGFSRALLLQNVLYAFVVIIMLLYKKNRYKEIITKVKTKVLNLKFIFVLSCSLTLLFWVFRAFGAAFARDLSDMTAGELIYYFTFYYSGGLRVFDLVFENISNTILDAHVLWGQFTFRGLYSLLKVHLGFDFVIPIARNMWLNGHILGGLYTVWGGFYIDFGYVGVIIFGYIYSFIPSRAYYNARLNTKRAKIDMDIIFYAYIFPLLLNMQGYPALFSRLFSASFWVIFSSAFIFGQLLIGNNKVRR